MNKAPKPWREYGRYGSVGIELVLSILLGYYAGHWADERWAGGHGYVTALGSLIGVYAGFRALFAVAGHMQRDIERAEREERGDFGGPPPSDGPSPSGPSPNGERAPTSRPRHPRDETNDDDA